MGAAYINQQQEWTLKDLEANRHYFFEITARHLGGDGVSANKGFLMKAIVAGVNGAEQQLSHTFDFKNGQLQRWKIPFVADSDTMKIRLLHDYMGPEYRYLSMQSYHLYEADRQTVRCDPCAE